MVDGQNVLSQLDETGLYTFAMPAHNVTVTATAIEFVPGEWVLTSLADLTENDVFVIVGTDEDEDATYALPNDGNSSAPVATPIVVVDGTLAGEPAVNLQWNLGGNATDGYTFYPNGDTENWLYCSTTANTGSNNNIKVGHGDNTRNVFVLDEDGYLITNDSNVTRYLSIYFNSGVAQDWRGYVNNTNALPISFYKKVTAVVDCEKIVLNEGNGYEWFRDFEAEGAGHTTPYTGVLLDCWTVAHEYASASMNHIGAEVDTLPQLFYNSNFAHSGDYSLRMKYRVLYAMPELDTTVDMSRLKLMAAHKGDIQYFVESAPAINRLTERSRVLIAEACTHAPLAEDIGREKIPRLLRKRVGQGLTVDIVAGKDFPSDLTGYDLVIHCGGCMFNRRFMLQRVEQARSQGVPMTNYGITIAHIKGILDKVSLP